MTWDWPYKNNQLIVVLIDNNSASSGEFFTSNIKVADNVIVLGSNTRGLGS